MRYRADIDGLRAVAIISVLLYHAKLPLFSGGGFVGVDIFFVLSGYLITGIVKTDLEAGVFSFTNFFERRVRRIFPILLTVILVVGLFGHIFLIFREYGYLTRGIIASVMFVQNVALFRSQGDYFAPLSEQNPLLHLWSLSIEEQFYLFYPGMLFLLWRHARRHVLKALLAVLLVSLLLAEMNLRQAPTAVFFLAHYRIWELLVGGIIHFLPFSKPLPKSFAQVLATSGFASICFSILAFDNHTRFPGLTALFPTLGTAAIIVAGTFHRTIVTRLLSLPAATWIGGMSYGLYLWHWPILSGAGLLAFVELGILHKLLLILCTVALAWLSLRYIETPFRTKQFVRNRKALFAGTAMTALVFIAAAIDAYRPQGWIRAAFWDNTPLVSKPDCMTKVCRNGSLPPTTVVMGDSHAEHLVPAFAKWDPYFGYVIQAGCPVLYGIDPSYENTEPVPCRAKEKLELVVKNPEIKKVIISARWQVYVDGTVRFVGTKRKPVQLCDENGCSRNDSTRRALFIRGLSKTVAILKESGKEILIVGSIPSPAIHIPRAMRLADLTPVTLPEWRPTREDSQALQRVAALLDSIGKRHQVRVVHPEEILCRGGCKYVLEGNPLFTDSEHLSPAGAEYVWSGLMDAQRAPATEDVE